jgi:hypothetical protein
MKMTKPLTFTQDELDILKTACRDTVVARACKLKVGEFRKIYKDVPPGVVLTLSDGKRFKFVDTDPALMGGGWWLRLPAADAA